MCLADAVGSGVQLFCHSFTSQPETKSEADLLALAQLVAEADRVQFSDPAFRQELSAWTRYGLPSSMMIPNSLVHDRFLSCFACLTAPTGARLKMVSLDLLLD